MFSTVFYMRAQSLQHKHFSLQPSMSQGTTKIEGDDGGPLVGGPLVRLVFHARLVAILKRQSNLRRAAGRGGRAQQMEAVDGRDRRARPTGAVAGRGRRDRRG